MFLFHQNKLIYQDFKMIRAYTTRQAQVYLFRSSINSNSPCRVHICMGKNQSKLPLDTLNDLQKTTHFDKKEIQQWYTGFSAEASQQQHTTTSFAPDNQPYWTKHDMNRLYEQFFPFGNPLPFSQIMFNMYDVNRNGRIEFSEFIMALSIVARGKFDEKLTWSFRLYDLDQDGFISKDEMLIVVDAIYLMIDNMVTLPSDQDTPQKRVDFVFSVMDKNRDERIDFEEFCQGAKADNLIIQSLFLYDGLV